MKRAAAVLALLGVMSCESSILGLTGVTPQFLPATKVALLTQPTTAAVNTNISPAIQVAVQSANSVTVANNQTANIAVTITPGTGTPGAALTGTSPQTVVNGVALFNNLRIGTAGTGYTLTFSAPGLTPVVSAAFDITP